MAVLKFDDLTHQELASLPHEKTVVFLCISPTEEHGIHLPLGMDLYFSAIIRDSLIENLQPKFPDWNFLIYPTIPAGTDVLKGPGSVSIPPAVLRAYIYAIAKQLAHDGFRTQIAVSGHGGPRHLVVLEELSTRMRWRHRTRFISASSRLLFEVLSKKFPDRFADYCAKNGVSLSAEEKAALPTDYHGGMLETSVLLLARKDLVRPYSKLEPAILRSPLLMRKSSGMKVGPGLGHLGSPHLARKELGSALIGCVSEDAMPDFERFLRGEDVRKKFHSKLYYIPFLRTDFRLFMLLTIYLTGFAAAWWFINSYFMGVYR